jgi:hypothetical protein
MMRPPIQVKVTTVVSFLIGAGVMLAISQYSLGDLLP